MGPMELADYVGLDTTKFIIDGMYIKHLFLRLSLSWCKALDLVYEGGIGAY